MYPTPEVASLIASAFVPLRIDVRTRGELMGRFGVEWTPTVVVLDSGGEERHRFEGFLPAPDFLANLEMGLARVAFSTARWDEAERRYREIVERYPDSEWAAEALYWAGVAKYKGTSDPVALQETAQRFQERYTDSSWAKKSSIWTRG